MYEQRVDDILSHPQAAYFSKGTCNLHELRGFAPPYNGIYYVLEWQYGFAM